VAARVLGWPRSFERRTAAAVASDAAAGSSPPSAQPKVANVVPVCLV
jgi:hypothetical protein